MIYAQIIILVLILSNFLRLLHQDCHGRKEVEATGFLGVVITILLEIVTLWLYRKAGTFSLLID